MYNLNKNIVTFLPPESIEPQAKQQLINISEMPFVFHHVAVMPDCHLGKGATVGSVIATKGAIIPAAVGVDVGCGMVAVKTKFFAKDLPDNLDKLRHGIERRIPLGAGAGNKKLTDTAIGRVSELKAIATQDYEKVDNHWTTALGTLGSGNHFIEICLDENDQVTPEFDAYIRDLLWAQDFARLNREEMMDRVMKELSYTLYGEVGHQSEIEIERINCHHNFTQQEQHFGKKVWITRKGAIQMKKGQKGIIPGSMGTQSYIVSGLENPLSFNSAPHGAGRRFSRSEAKRRFTMNDLEAAMGDISFRHSKSLIDEIPMAYKDIDEVIENSKELVQIDHTLKQIVNIKGD